MSEDKDDEFNINIFTNVEEKDDDEKNVFNKSQSSLLIEEKSDNKLGSNKNMENYFNQNSMNMIWYHHKIS